jgi:uncharacterized protein (TIGR03118 family)
MDENVRFGRAVYVARKEATQNESAVRYLNYASANLFSLSSSSYAVHNLVSDGGVPADHTDPDLINPWGLVFNPTAVAWVSDAETGVSTLYNGAGVKQSLVVTIPTPPNGTPPSHPTGIVFSGGADFVVAVGTLSGPSRFMFATEDGTISGWAPNVDPTHAILKVDNSTHDAIYKGLALAGNVWSFPIRDGFSPCAN